MAIRGTLSRVLTVGGKVTGVGNVKAQQVSMGGSSAATTDITAKSINELADVNASETDDGLLSYDQASDKWTTTTVLDGGTF
jgi:hypothetical protein|tara:strand:+ start:235 stop:480 length:246 start_codon:yes stop_codon:yes gene_type:complete